MLPSRLRVLTRPAAAVAMSIVVVAYGASGDPSGGDVADRRFDPASTELEVRFQDSSVPPQYHRSYSLTVEGQRAHVVVDSYGEVLADEIVELPDEVWRPFVADLPGASAGIDEPEVTDEGCVGGTHLTVAVTSDEADFYRRVSNCGSDQNDVIADELATLLDPIQEAVELERLTATD